jgi:membrane protein
MPDRLLAAGRAAMTQWPGRIIVGTAAGLVRIQIFDRAMTVAAQAFTSIFPLLIMLAIWLRRAKFDEFAHVVQLPDAARQVLTEALDNNGVNAFGVVGSLVVLVSATSLARALTRAYAMIWEQARPSTGFRALWRSVVTVLVLSSIAIAARSAQSLTHQIPHSRPLSAIASLLADCALTVVPAWLLLGGGVPMRRLLPGGLVFGLVMLVLRPAGSVYLPHALRVSANRYGPIGVAFTYIGWLYVLSFCLLAAAVAGHVLAGDPGGLGRLVRGTEPAVPSAQADSQVSTASHPLGGSHPAAPPADPRPRKTQGGDLA